MEPEADHSQDSPCLSPLVDVCDMESWEEEVQTQYAVFCVCVCWDASVLEDIPGHMDHEDHTCWNWTTPFVKAVRDHSIL